MTLQNEYIDDGTAFLRINPKAINPDALADFSIFERFVIKAGKKYRYRCLLFDTKSIPKDKLIKLLQTWEQVYIHRTQKQIYDDYVKRNLEYILKHESIDVGTKTTTFINLSTDLIQESFEVNFGSKGLSPKQFDNIKKLISRAVEFISDMSSLSGLADLIGHDYDTHTHSIKVGWLMATFINGNRDLFPVKSRSDLNTLLTQAAVVGFLHDIGKTKIPKNVLNKRDKLSTLEYVMIQAHTAYSVSLLFEAGLPKSILQGVLYHHENDDGSGYPCGIKGDDIPLIAKIAHVADVFDALTSRRPYKEPKTPYEALAIMTGQNPDLEVLQKYEQEIRENKKPPVVIIVRNENNPERRRARESEIMVEESEKRTEERTILRDRGMAHCFDADILKRFILTINRSDSFQLDGLL